MNNIIVSKSADNTKTVLFYQSLILTRASNWDDNDQQPRDDGILLVSFAHHPDDDDTMQFDATEFEEAAMHKGNVLSRTGFLIPLLADDPTRKGCNSSLNDGSVSCIHEPRDILRVGVIRRRSKYKQKKKKRN